jgi:hypothetical protein
MDDILIPCPSLHSRLYLGRSGQKLVYSRLLVLCH